MAVDLSKNMSDDAYNKINSDTPDHADGFGDDEDDETFEGLFDDLDLGTFGGLGDQTSSNSDTFGKSNIGNNYDFGPVNGGMHGTGNNNNNSWASLQNMQQPAKPRKPDRTDEFIDLVCKCSKAVWRVVANIFYSVKSRNADDIGLYSKNMLMVGIGILGVTLVLFLIGLSGDLDSMKVLSSNTVVSGLLCVGTGLFGIGTAALVIVIHKEPDNETIKNVPEVNNSEPMETDDDSEIDGAAFDELFGNLADIDDTDEDNDDSEADFGSLFKGGAEPEVVKDAEAVIPEPLNYSKLTDEVSENAPLLNRMTLFDIFKNFFPLNTTGFSSRVELSYDDPEFLNVKTFAIQALAAAAKCDVIDIKSNVIKIISTFSCYELYIERIKGFSNLDDIEREMLAYFREDAYDESVVCTAVLERDTYRIVITKGKKSIVTFGDCFTLDNVCNYIKDTEHELPFIAGIDDFGNPIMSDARLYTTMLIAGKSRSGKSWYVFAIMMALMAFNTPEDVEFIIIDPKESNAFKTMALMPHVCGLHNDSNILQIMRDLVEVEGARRKKLLADNKCDDIWALRNRKNIKLPVLYLVIDEVMTVLDNLGDELGKEFNRLLNIIITQLPSQGICLIFVPHRAVKVINKTSRVNMAFTAAVKASEEVVKETLDIKKWTRTLIEPGDTALYMSDVAKPTYVKVAALTTSDAENTELITSIARTYYKMGVDIPDMSTVGYGFNRDEDKIKEELKIGDGSKHVQFDINSINNIDEDLDTLINEVKLDD